MDLPNILPALLAPTWAERAAAEDALRRWLLSRPVADDLAEPWPAEVQTVIDGLLPDASTFLSALLGFWADVCAARWHGVVYDVPTPASAWASADTARFPLDEEFALPGKSEPGRGHWVWQFLERLGSRQALLETQWLACLEHPDEVVAQAAERALTDVPQCNLDHLLRLLDRGGPRGTRRAALVGSCLNLNQLHRLSRPPANVAAWLARSQVLLHLPPVWVPKVMYAWRRHWAAMSAPEFAELTYGLAERDPTATHWLDEIQLAASHDSDLQRRCAAAFWLGRRAPERHRHRLRALTNDHPWVLHALCAGLSTHQRVPTGLLRVIAHVGLGNESGFDGEPHDSVLALLIGARNRAEALPEIHRWLEQSAGFDNDYSNTLDSNWRMGEMIRLAEAFDKDGRSLARYLPGWRAIAEKGDDHEGELSARLQRLAVLWDVAWE